MLSRNRSTTILKSVGGQVLAAARSADTVAGYDNDQVRALAEAMCDGDYERFDKQAMRVAPEVMNAIRYMLSKGVE